MCVWERNAIAAGKATLSVGIMMKPLCSRATAAETRLMWSQSIYLRSINVHITQSIIDAIRFIQHWFSLLCSEHTRALGRANVKPAATPPSVIECEPCWHETWSPVCLSVSLSVTLHHRHLTFQPETFFFRSRGAAAAEVKSVMLLMGTWNNNLLYGKLMPSTAGSLKKTVSCHQFRITTYLFVFN